MADPTAGSQLCEEATRYVVSLRQQAEVVGRGSIRRALKQGGFNHAETKAIIAEAQRAMWLRAQTSRTVAKRNPAGGCCGASRGHPGAKERAIMIRYLTNRSGRSKRAESCE
jgi:hypothetical protein